MLRQLARIPPGQPLFFRDPRTIDWWITGNLPFPLFLLVSYVYVVKYFGPRFMKNRKPMDFLKPLILAYNGTMVTTNAFFCYKFLMGSYIGGGYNLFCQGIDFNARDEATLQRLSLMWFYAWVRVADFLDTIFFVLRKKDAHVSLLHVAHHCMVVFGSWYGLSYGADGQSLFGICLNSFVHVVMYSYYFLSLLGPSARKYLWWKKQLTQLQLGQFFVGILHAVIPLFIDCGYPVMHIIIAFPQGVFFIVMFMRFYSHAYRNRASKVQ
ncbi:very long chain fatty acid elongase AAEL008004-like [Ornithodoros turicata]|uniref:very long chain fatty acid elongase AAEL008004-like n=1 Tax=Ornithodoros turicata TaxID=34597 RepID=UPI0031391E72